MTPITIPMKIQKVPHTLNVSHADRFFDRDPKTGEPVADGTLSAMRGALSKASETCAALISLSESLVADQTILPAEKETRLRDRALKAGEKAAAQLDGARAKLTEEIGRVRKATMPLPPNDTLAAEIRAAFRQTKDPMKAIDEAIAAGDHATIGAVLTGPRFLTGLGPAQLGIAARMYREAYHPADHARLERLEGAVEAVDLAADGLVSFIKKTATASATASADAKVKQAEAEKALAS